MVGKVGRITGAVTPGLPGAVRLPVRGGTEDFHAWSHDGSTVSVGTRVVVLEYDPPRTVTIASL